MKPLSAIILVSLVVLLLSFWQRNSLPENLDIVPSVLEEPSQVSTNKSAFETQFNDVTYTVQPQYSYELNGVVVSFRHHDGNSRMHRFANDHLNMLDVCVVWGDNAGHPALQNIDFWNGIFTCVYKTRDQEAWQAFNEQQLSNNHLISEDPFIRSRVQDIEIGDQIRIRGYLSSYGSQAGSQRGTSTTRTDTGNGACETIYVEQFEILESAVNPWRVSMYISLLVLLGALVMHFRRPFRPYRESG